MTKRLVGLWLMPFWALQELSCVWKGKCMRMGTGNIFVSISAKPCTEITAEAFKKAYPQPEPLCCGGFLCPPPRSSLTPRGSYGVKESKSFMWCWYRYLPVQVACMAKAAAIAPHSLPGVLASRSNDMHCLHMPCYCLLSFWQDAFEHARSDAKCHHIDTGVPVPRHQTSTCSDFLHINQGSLRSCAEQKMWVSFVDELGSKCTAMQ